MSSSKDNLYFSYSFSHQRATKLDSIFRGSNLLRKFHIPQSAQQRSIFYFNTLLSSTSHETRSEASNLLHISYSTMWKPAAGTIISIQKNFPSFLTSFLPSIRRSNHPSLLPRFIISIRCHALENRSNPRKRKRLAIPLFIYPLYSYK